MYTSITWHGSPLNQTFGWLHGLPWRGRDETAHWTDGVLVQVNYQLGEMAFHIWDGFLKSQE